MNSVWAGVGQANVFRGALSIRPIGMDHETRLRTPAEAGHIYLHASLLKEVAPDICAHDPDRLELLPVFGEADAVMARLVEAVRELTIQPIPASQLCVDFLAAALAAQLARHHSNAQHAVRLLPKLSLSRRGTSRIADYIEAHLHESITLDQLAGVADLSVVQFIRQFKRATGLTPHQYVMRARVNRARHLLVEGKESIAILALHCGFSSQEHLTRIFGMFLGTTPAAYRRAAGRSLISD
ncbi:helix-turn-helix transcriptional regulator [Bradyrhizobium jicamae]|uniref:Helix-turn-helix transcriptional regulator n=1 Tax=Bradyrhizobium jicamae TaxID=280332 RepID=A0ABS5FJ81_9BRAD|nr:AraC family transcriptional regulator [Bradyrhizobium jicamae]MBR0796849.1 helix-turn-helix transcriptional regulator [Bradyrhizobium jicamae]